MIYMIGMDQVCSAHASTAVHQTWLPRTNAETYAGHLVKNRKGMIRNGSPVPRIKVDDSRQQIVKKGQVQIMSIIWSFKALSRSRKDTKQHAATKICNTWGIFTCKFHNEGHLQLVETRLWSLGSRPDVINGCFPANITMYLGPKKRTLQLPHIGARRL